MKAVFFDRDGVLNKELGKYVVHHTEWELNSWVVPFMHALGRAGYNFFIATNQGGIARGLYTQNDLFDIHAKLVNTLSAQGIAFKEIFYCPHHPNYSKCLCRKPDSLMLEKAIAKYGVDVERSFMIGDTERDWEAAAKAGVRAIKIVANHPPDAASLQVIRDITGIDLSAF